MTINPRVFNGRIIIGSLGGGPGGLSDGDYGDIIVSGSATVFTIDTAVVTYAKFQDVTGLSVVGRAGNTSGVTAAITSTADYDVLQRSGTSLVMQPYRVENRTSDPGSPAVGQLWLRTDL
jgi:hypothetical protein